VASAGTVVAGPVPATAAPAEGSGPATAAPPGGAGAAASPRGTRPVYDYARAIREELTVTSTVDSDRDGRRDRVAVRVIRPRETAQGLRVPVIFQPSPYFAGLNDVPNHDDVDRDDARRAVAGPPVSRAEEKVIFGGYLDNYFVPRGYAVVFADSLGSGGSEGCPTSGGENETQGMKAVVDWLNGRAPGSYGSGAKARAGWSTGRVGMIGVSYNGTLPNAVAATGVRGLETIVPIAAISSWYDYYRANGGVVAPGGFQGEDTDVLAKAVLTRAMPQACADVVEALAAEQDRLTGDYSAFWHERNYLRDAGRVRASVLAVHGLNDWNVKSAHVGQWWDALGRHGVPRKLWLHQAGHTDPFNVRREVWLRTLHRWFDQWLHRIDTGIMREPTASVETAPGTWRQSRTWPVPGSRPVPVALGGPSDEIRSFVDNPARTAEDLVDGGQAADPGRVAYLTDPLPAPVRLSGTPRISVRASLDGPSPYLTALLVDYGTADRFQSLAPAPGTDCVAPGIPEDPGCFGRVAYVTERTPWKIVSRGWLDVRNRRSPGRSEPIEPGRFYSFGWRLQPKDHVFEAGHRIGVVVISTDRDFTLRYPAGTVVRVDVAASRAVLPLVSARMPG
jgi:X-Pro dipeptidyl-peptidase